MKCFHRSMTYDDRSSGGGRCLHSLLTAVTNEEKDKYSDDVQQITIDMDCVVLACRILSSISESS